MSRNIFVLGIFTAVIAASCGHSGSNAPPPQTPSQGASPGLTDTERATFDHLSEGSVMFPLAWLDSLEQDPSPSTSAQRQRFRDNLERFGFIADPKGPSGLPVGFTID